MVALCCPRNGFFAKKGFAASRHLADSSCTQNKGVAKLNKKRGIHSDWGGALVLAAGNAILMEVGFKPSPERFHLTIGGVSGSQRSQPARMNWQATVRRMPDLRWKCGTRRPQKDLQVPAYNDSGETEARKMMVRHIRMEPDLFGGGKDTPPVGCRKQPPALDKALDAARDGIGCCERTPEFLVGLQHVRRRAYASRDVAANNSKRWCVEVRMIYTASPYYHRWGCSPRPQRAPRAGCDSFIQ